MTITLYKSDYYKSMEKHTKVFNYFDGVWLTS